MDRKPAVKGTAANEAYGPFSLISLIFLLALCTACSEPSPPSFPASRSGMTISGQVVFEGTPPPPQRLRFDADPQCLALVGQDDVHDEDVLVSDGGGLQNVFVYVTRGLNEQSYPISAERVTLDQQNCRYRPRVLGVQVGQTLTLRNSDPVLHTVRGDAAKNQRFDIATPIQGMEVARTFQAAETMLPIKCDMHPWMQAYVAVVDHPFFDVTDAAGTYAIAGLPPGSYTLEFWHERFGTRSQTVTVVAGRSTAVDVVYKPPS